MIAGGGADVTVEWLPAALAAREQGMPLVDERRMMGAANELVGGGPDASRSWTIPVR